jgi:hypothetical protein
VDPRSYWTPNDWLRLVALIGGFALALVGCWMLYRGIQAEGTIDLKSALLSGSIKGSSAGLYICFFAVFVIALVLGSIVIGGNGIVADGHAPSKNLQRVLWAQLVAIALCGVGIAYLPELRAILPFAIGVLLASTSSTVFAIIRASNA